MFRSAKGLIGYDLKAGDGDIGTVKDLLFDDEAWTVRYVVAETGGWLTHRQILLTPPSFRRIDWERQELETALTLEQVEKSPTIEKALPVSRQQEIQLREYYGWPPYWGPPMAAFPPPATGAYPAEPNAEVRPAEGGDPHLRSVKEVAGYRVAATDGEMGHVEDCILDTEDWALRYFAIDTRKWLPGRKVLIAPDWVRAVDWGERRLVVDHTRREVEHSPEFDPTAPVNRTYETRLYDYYGRPVYWTE